MRAIKRIALALTALFALTAQVFQGSSFIASPFPLVMPAGVPAPVALFRMNDQGAVLQDSIGAFTGSYIGSVVVGTPVSPYEVTSIKYPGATSGHTAAGLPGMTAADFTVAVFLRSNTSAVNNRVICHGLPGTSPFTGWCISSAGGSATTLNIQVGTGTAQVSASLTFAYPPNNGTALMAATYTQSTGVWVIYSNQAGVGQSATATVTQVMSPAATPYIALGSAPATGNGCACSLSDAYFFNSVLTVAQLDSIWAAGFIKAAQ